MARKLAKQNPRTHHHNLTMNENPNPIPAILPRSVWESQIAYLWAVFRAKKALDEIERIQNEKT
ncbi:MAG: hypothetical protein EWV61_08140 [Microcystis aeruginosa Ma_AC_P_19900807_S300]|nr:MAG: hypothetical protein EWV61_08140 [Microcystis aeruginosa Ma_AC_P_19900807_S300]